MAFQMALTDGFGNENPQSYWRVKFVAVDLTIPQARCVLLGYRNKDAHDTGKLPFQQREYTLGGDDFMAMMAQYQSGEGSTDLFALSYNVAKTTKDVGEGEEKVSFFADATEVE